MGKAMPWISILENGRWATDWVSPFEDLFDRAFALARKAARENRPEEYLLDDEVNPPIHFNSGEDILSYKYLFES